MTRGRPPDSKIRQEIVEILHFLGRGYGYDIYKVHQGIFPKVTMRSVYYQLKRGATLGIFAVESVAKEKGEFSWGGEVEKVYYKLGPNAKPIVMTRVKEQLEKEALLKLAQKPQ